VSNRVETRIKENRVNVEIFRRKRSSSFRVVCKLQSTAWLCALEASAYLRIRQIKIGVKGGVAPVEVRLPFIEIGPLNGGLRTPHQGHGRVIGRRSLQELGLAIDEPLEKVVRGKPEHVSS